MMIFRLKTLNNCKKMGFTKVCTAPMSGVGNSCDGKYKSCKCSTDYKYTKDDQCPGVNMVLDTSDFCEESGVKKYKSCKCPPKYQLAVCASPARLGSDYCHDGDASSSKLYQSCECPSGYVNSCQSPKELAGMTCQNKSYSDTGMLQLSLNVREKCVCPARFVACEHGGAGEYCEENGVRKWEMCAAEPPVQASCEASGYKDTPPAGQVCSIVTIPGGITCYDNCKSCPEGLVPNEIIGKSCNKVYSLDPAIPSCYRCEDIVEPTISCGDAGLESEQPVGYNCTPETYMGMQCYKDCVPNAPPPPPAVDCTDVGYLNEKPEYNNCEETTYEGKTCYNNCQLDCNAKYGHLVGTASDGGYVYLVERDYKIPPLNEDKCVKFVGKILAGEDKSICTTWHSEATAGFSMKPDMQLSDGLATTLANKFIKVLSDNNQPVPTNTAVCLQADNYRPIVGGFLFGCGPACGGNGKPGVLCAKKPSTGQYMCIESGGAPEEFCYSTCYSNSLDKTTYCPLAIFRYTQVLCTRIMSLN